MNKQTILNQYFSHPKDNPLNIITTNRIDNVGKIVVLVWIEKDWHHVNIMQIGLTVSPHLLLEAMIDKRKSSCLTLHISIHPVLLS